METLAETQSLEGMPAAQEPDFTVPTIGTYYKLNNRQLTFEDCWRLTQDLGFLVLAAARILRIRIDFPTYLAAPQPIESTLIPESDLPPECQAKIAPYLKELASLEFHSQFYHSPRNLLMASTAIGVVLLSPDNKTIAKVIYVHQMHGQRKTEKAVYAFISCLTTGKYLVTGIKSKGFASSPNVIVKSIRARNLAKVWDLHQQRLMKTHDAAAVQINTSADYVRIAGDYENNGTWYHIKRGVYEEVPLSEVELILRARGVLAPTRAVEPGNLPPLIGAAEEPISETATGIQIAIAKLQHPSESWKSKLPLLIVTAVLFALSFKSSMSWKNLGMLLLILFIHELGHFAAMKMFGYKNLRMFFLPFFGAAVSGRHYSVPGWRKAIVSLMGPLPGIMIGSALLLSAKSLSLGKTGGLFGVMFLVLNGLNLLPFLPLDGGWFWNTVLFSRNRWAETIFRVATASLLIACSLLFLNRPILLVLVGVFMLISTRLAFYLGKIAEDLKREGILREALPDDEIPIRITNIIIQRINAVLPKARLHAPQMANAVLNIYERIATKPPSVIETALLIFAYFAAITLVIALVLVPWLLRFLT